MRFADRTRVALTGVRHRHHACSWPRRVTGRVTRPACRHPAHRRQTRTAAEDEPAHLTRQGH